MSPFLAPGQGNAPNPPSRFANHFIVTIGGTMFDPSYGLGTFTDRKKYEMAAFAGLIFDGSEISDPNEEYLLNPPPDDGDPTDSSDEINVYSVIPGSVFIP
jgi:hypothetical protein